MAKELSEKDLEAFELDDDLLELVNGGMMNKQVDAIPHELCEKCHTLFSLADFGYKEIGESASRNRYLAEHYSICTGK